MCLDYESLTVLTHAFSYHFFFVVSIVTVIDRRFSSIVPQSERIPAQATLLYAGRMIFPRLSALPFDVHSSGNTGDGKDRSVQLDGQI